jgi:hypothetical protein
VVALEHNCLHAGLAGCLDDVEIVRQSGEEVRERMTVKVHRAGYVDKRTPVGASGHDGLLSFRRADARA